MILYILTKKERIFISKRAVGLLFIVSIVILSLVSCQTQNPTPDLEVKELSDLMGLEKEEVYRKLDLEEGKNVEPDDMMKNLYLLTVEQKVYGESMNVGLFFDPENNDKMVGFEYRKEFDGDAKAGYDLTKKLSKGLLEDIGEPDTYPTSPNRIVDLPDFDNMEKDSSYSEEWNLDNGLTATLMTYITPDAGALVRLMYGEPRFNTEN